MAKRQLKEQRVVWRGQEGQYVIGLPPRDLTLDQWEAYPAQTRALGLATGLYELVDGKEPDTEPDEWPEVLVDPGEDEEGED